MTLIEQQASLDPDITAQFEAVRGVPLEPNQLAFDQFFDLRTGTMRAITDWAVDNLKLDPEEIEPTIRRPRPSGVILGDRAQPLADIHFPAKARTDNAPAPNGPPLVWLFDGTDVDFEIGVRAYGSNARKIPTDYTAIGALISDTL